MKSRNRIFGTFSLRTLLAVLAAIAMTLSVMVWRAESRRKVFDKLRSDGAIVRYAPSPWGPLFAKPALAKFYVNVEGDRLRIGDTLYNIDEAEKFLLEQKAIANRNGLDNFEFYTMESVDTKPSESIHSRILNFGLMTFNNGGGFDRSLYEDEWEANRNLHR
jgi:hypothetical protein